MFKIVLSNLKTMINASTFSKGLIIFLVYYLTIIFSTVTSSETETQIENDIKEIFIKISGSTLEELFAEEDNMEFQQKLVDDNKEILTRQQNKQIMASIQLGIKSVIQRKTSEPQPDSIPSDFNNILKLTFNNMHDAKNTLLTEFNFSTYAPFTFHYLRCLFGINPNDYVTSFCDSSLCEFSNPGASKSIFYQTPDNKFIIKTVQQTEDECLLRLLPTYTTYLTENRNSLLPKFSGFYNFLWKSVNNKLVAMNNLLPSDIKMHEKYDLKGSTYGREASDNEKGKTSPTLKDLDFNKNHPEGIFLKPDTRLALLNTIEKDCKILKDYNIMDYSILMGVHNLDANDGTSKNKKAAIKRWKSLMADSVQNKSNQTEAWTVPDTNYASLSGSIPAKNVNGDRLLLFVGIIDILQTFRVMKSLEYGLKSFQLKITPSAKVTAESISVQPPEFYASRFQNYLTNSVFKPMLSPTERGELSKQPDDRPLSGNQNRVGFKCLK